MGKKGIPQDKIARMLTDYRLFTLTGLFDPVNWTWRLEKSKQDWDVNCSKNIYSIKFFNFTIYNERFIFYNEKSGRLSDSNTKFVGNSYYIELPNGFKDEDTLTKSFSDVLCKAITLLDQGKYKHLSQLLKPIS